MANKITTLDDDKARPLGDTGDGQTGVPADEQGISNRPGDAGEDEDEDDFDEDADDDDLVDVEEDDDSSPS